MEERYSGNNAYGAATVLRAYSSYDKPINAVIPHGCNYDAIVYPGESAAPLPAVLSWPPFRDEAWAQYKHVVPACAPFLYALAMVPESDKPREGTLFAPAHSTDYIDMDQDWRDLAKLCDTMEAPVTVQLYFRDIERDRAKFFERRGHKVISCGRLGDDMFLARVVENLQRVKVACSNEIGSHTFYSIAAGVPYHLVGDNPTRIMQTPRPGMEVLYAWNDDALKMREYLRTQFAKPGPITAQQKALAFEMLGAARFKTPAQLLADLRECEHAIAPKRQGATT